MIVATHINKIQSIYQDFADGKITDEQRNIRVTREAESFKADLPENQTNFFAKDQSC